MDGLCHYRQAQGMEQILLGKTDRRIADFAIGPRLGFAPREFTDYARRTAGIGIWNG